MSGELISVIVPVYNAGEYLLPMVKSVLLQSYPQIELLLIDDGSTDGSGLLCEKIARADPRVRVIHQENKGQSAARNAGLAAAAGEYISFADHDDILHPRMLELLVGAIRKFDVPVAVCDFENVPQEKMESLCFDSSFPEMSLLSQEMWLHGLFAPSWRTPVWNKLYRRDALSGLSFGDLHLGEDNLFSYQVIKSCKHAAFVFQKLYFQRMHGDNFEYTGSRYYVDLLSAKEAILQDVQQRFPDEYRHFQKLFLYECCRIFNTCTPDVYALPQRKAILEMIRRNAKGLLLSELPAGHKLLFAKLKYSRRIPKEKIIL